MDKKDYLDISKASDLKNPKERRVYRIFETLPGILSLGTIFLVFLLSWLLPSWAAIFIICFCFYYLFRIIYFSLHQIIGYFKIKSYLKKDWLKELKKLKPSSSLGITWKDVYHIVILPSYKESKQIIKESLDALESANYPKEKIMVVLAIEARAGDNAKKIAKEIEKEYTGKFYKFLLTAHPDNVSGEIGGKGSNVAHAGREVKKLVDDVVISELQAEPWGPDAQRDQPVVMTPDQMKKVIGIAKKTGFREVYFWGVEWWYMMKEKKGNSIYWDIARDTVKGR